MLFIYLFITLNISWVSVRAIAVCSYVVYKERSNLGGYAESALMYTIAAPSSLGLVNTVSVLIFKVLRLSKVCEAQTQTEFFLKCL